jgi:hypothetical protein
MAGGSHAKALSTSPFDVDKTITFLEAGIGLPISIARSSIPGESGWRPSMHRQAASIPTRSQAVPGTNINRCKSDSLSPVAASLFQAYPPPFVPICVPKIKTGAPKIALGKKPRYIAYIIDLARRWGRLRTVELVIEGVAPAAVEASRAAALSPSVK